MAGISINTVKGLFILIYLFITINIGTLFLLFAYLFILPISRPLFVRFNLFLQETYLSQIVFFMERQPNLFLELSGDDVPEGESALVLPNHQNHDYFVLYSYAFRKGRIGNVRTFLKQETLAVPGFGLSMWLCDWPFVSRDWSKDQKYLTNLFNRYRNDGQPLWLWLFAEGTRITKSKLDSSQKYAKENNYPHVFKNVLLPRHKGFIAAVRSLSGAGGVVNYIYDVTLAYSGWFDRQNQPLKFPGPFDILFLLDPTKRFVLHLHLKRIPISDLPPVTDEEGLKKWLLERFKEKDELLDVFQKDGHFPGARVAPRLEVSRFTFPLAVWFVVFLSAMFVSYFVIRLVW